MKEHKNSNGRIWLGAILIIVGALIFLKNFHFNIFQFDLFSWPFILILIGIIILINQRDSFFGFLLIIIGGAGIASKYLHISFRSVFSEYWPVLLIILGVYTLFKSIGTNSKSNMDTIESEECQVDIFSIFGDSTKQIKTNNFLGGKITSIFGDLKVDLRQSHLANGKQVLDTLTMFGATEIFLPNDWEVIIKTTTIFGGFDDKRSKTESLKELNEKVLVIKGLVLFGGGEIRS